MPKNNFYVGFPTFESLLAAAKNKDLYLTRSVITTPAQMNTQMVEWNVTAAGFTDNLCLYWRMNLGGYNTIDGHPMFRDENYEKQCSERCDRMIEQLTQIAFEQNFQIISGLIAFPKNLLLLKGITKILTYDKDSNSYSRNGTAAKAVAV